MPESPTAQNRESSKPEPPGLEKKLRRIARARTRLAVCFWTLPVYVVAIWILLNNGRNVDTAGVLFSKHKFKTVAGFKQGLLKEKHRFVRGFASHLLSYALCRAVGPADSPALDEITAMTLAGKDGMRAVLKSVAMSEPFLHKNMKESTEDKQ